jgi:hypothetical protein
MATASFQPDGVPSYLSATRPDFGAFRSPELRVLLACARWPQTPADRDEIQCLLQEDLDPGRLLLLAQHHRLVPLLAHNLSAAAPANLPEPLRSLLHQLRQSSAANTYRGLRSLAEIRRLVQEFEASGIEVRVLKGIPLAQTVFGDLSLRSVGDVDLLIAEGAIPAADAILRAAGYRGLFQIERFTPKRLAFYRTHWKDIAYSNPESGSEVDLHWRCFRNSEMPGRGLCSPRSNCTVHFGNFEVRTLPPTETLLYLCVHGTLDGWIYLKSLADIGALVRTMPAPELDRVAERALRYGVLPEFSAALHLARQYFGIEHWSGRLLGPTDPTVAHILRFARRSLESNNFLGGRESVSPGSMMAFELGLRHTFRYRRELLLRVLFRARMWQTIPLPDFLFAIYPLLSPVEWVIFRVRQWLGKPPSTIGLSV